MWGLAREGLRSAACVLMTQLGQAPSPQADIGLGWSTSLLGLFCLFCVYKPHTPHGPLGEKPTKAPGTNFMGLWVGSQALLLCTRHMSLPEFTAPQQEALSQSFPAAQTPALLSAGSRARAAWIPDRPDGGHSSGLGTVPTCPPCMRSLLHPTPSAPALHDDACHSLPGPSSSHTAPGILH